jgi:hypothetical protein
MTDDLAYFTEVLKRLDALHDRATKSQDSHMANLATATSEPIGVLVADAPASDLGADHEAIIIEGGPDRPGDRRG